MHFIAMHVQTAQANSFTQQPALRLLLLGLGSALLALRSVVANNAFRATDVFAFPRSISGLHYPF